MRNSDGERVVLMQSDLATLDGVDKPRDLPCQVEPLRPALGYDLRFHVGYAAQCKAGDLSPGGRLTVIFRVSPESGGAGECFSQTVALPTEVPDGDVTFEGFFEVGPGKYSLEWLIRDHRDRRYAKSWTVAAAPPERGMLISLGSGGIRPADEIPAAASRRSTGIPVHLLINLSPPENSSGVFPA